VAAAGSIDEGVDKVAEEGTGTTPALAAVAAAEVDTDTTLVTALMERHLLPTVAVATMAPVLGISFA